MKQLGNLALVCVRRPEVLKQLRGGTVSVHVGEGPKRAALCAEWDGGTDHTEGHVIVAFRILDEEAVSWHKPHMNRCYP